MIRQAKQTIEFFNKNGGNYQNNIYSKLVTITNNSVSAYNNKLVFFRFMEGEQAHRTINLNSTLWRQSASYMCNDVRVYNNSTNEPVQFFIEGMGSTKVLIYVRVTLASSASIELRVEWGNPLLENKSDPLTIGQGYALAKKTHIQSHNISQLRNIYFTYDVLKEIETLGTYTAINRIVDERYIYQDFSVLSDTFSPPFLSYESTKVINELPAIKLDGAGFSQAIDGNRNKQRENAAQYGFTMFTVAKAATLEGYHRLYSEQIGGQYFVSSYYTNNNTYVAMSYAGGVQAMQTGLVANQININTISYGGNISGYTGLTRNNGVQIASVNGNRPLFYTAQIGAYNNTSFYEYSNASLYEIIIIPTPLHITASTFITQIEEYLTLKYTTLTYSVSFTAVTEIQDTVATAQNTYTAVVNADVSYNYESETPTAKGTVFSNNVLYTQLLPNTDIADASNVNNVIISTISRERKTKSDYERKISITQLTHTETRHTAKMWKTNNINNSNAYTVYDIDNTIRTYDIQDDDIVSIDMYISDVTKLNNIVVNSYTINASELNQGFNVVSIEYSNLSSISSMAITINSNAINYDVYYSNVRVTKQVDNYNQYGDIVTIKNHLNNDVTIANNLLVSSTSFDDADIAQYIYSVFDFIADKKFDELASYPVYNISFSLSALQQFPEPPQNYYGHHACILLILAFFIPKKYLFSLTERETGGMYLLGESQLNMSYVCLDRRSFVIEILREYINACFSKLTYINNKLQVINDNRHAYELDNHINDFYVISDNQIIEHQANKDTRNEKETVIYLKSYTNQPLTAEISADEKGQVLDANSNLDLAIYYNDLNKNSYYYHIDTIKIKNWIFEKNEQGSGILDNTDISISNVSFFDDRMSIRFSSLANDTRYLNGLTFEITGVAFIPYYTDTDDLTLENALTTVRREYRYLDKLAPLQLTLSPSISIEASVLATYYINTNAQYQYFNEYKTGIVKILCIANDNNEILNYDTTYISLNVNNKRIYGVIESIDIHDDNTMTVTYRQLL